MERAHERKAAPRCNDLARSFVYSYCTRYHLGLQASSSSKGQCSRLERIALIPGALCEKLTLAAIRFILDTISTFR